MLQYSFSTVYMAVITSNLLLILITLLFRNTKIMINAGYKLLALFIALTALRFLLPIEFPFTRSVFLTDHETISQVVSYVRHPRFQISDYEISVWTFLQAIWIIGFVINLIRYIHEHMKARYYILANSLDATESEPYRSLLEKICRERRKSNRFRVLTVTGISRPMLYGVFFPHILIPENMEFTQDDLYYSLVHEASHHFHHDLLIKQLIKLIAMAYWWNPVCYILIRKVDTILEMRVDDTITASGKDTVICYLHSLLGIGERAAEIELDTLPKSVTLALLREEEDELTQRYLMLTTAGQKKKQALNAALFALVISIYGASHLFILEAYYVEPEVMEETIGQTADNSYAILREDGTYDIYYYDYFIENTGSLKFYFSDIPVYTEKEITDAKN